MTIMTKVFGEITIDDDRIITFPKGIVGFPELTEFALLHDSDKGADSIHWLQSIQEPAFAMPVMDPLRVCPDYNPEVDDEILKNLGELNPDDMLVLVTMTVPKDVEQMTVNLKAPIIINADTRKGAQIIVENQDYEVKYKIYDILKQKKEA